MQGDEIQSNDPILPSQPVESNEPSVPPQPESSTSTMMQATESESNVSIMSLQPETFSPSPLDPPEPEQQVQAEDEEKVSESSSSIWSSLTSSATASWKQAIESTGELESVVEKSFKALDGASDILSTAAQDAKKLTTSIVSDESDSSDNNQPQEEGRDDAAATESSSPTALLNSFKMGWSSMTSSVVEQTTASIKQAESVVEKSFQSLDRASELSSSIVQNTKSSINKAVASGDGWMPNPAENATEKEEGAEITFEKADLAVENLGENGGSQNDLFDFR